MLRPDSSPDGRPWLKGAVLDDSSGKPIPYCSVLVLGTKMGTQSDDRGLFRIVLPDTVPCDVMAKAIGYEKQVVEVKVPAGRVDTLVFRLRHYRSAMP